MRIRYLNTGNLDHVDRNLGQSLIRAGIAEEVKSDKSAQSSLETLRQFQREMNSPASPDKVNWTVELVGTTQKALCIVMRVGAYQVCYGGDPKTVNARCEWPGGGRFLSGFGRACPQAVIDEYSRAYKRARPSEKLVLPNNTSSDVNSRMAEEIKVMQRVLSENDAALADFVRPQESRIPRVIGGPDDSEVTYEKGDPGF